MPRRPATGARAGPLGTGRRRPRDLRRRAGETLDREPADLVRGRALLRRLRRLRRAAPPGNRSTPVPTEERPDEHDRLRPTRVHRTILDGYCDVCGSPGPAGAATASPSAVAGSAASPPARPPAPRPSAVAGRCTEPGCSGTVVDGYCDVCGARRARPRPGSPTAARGATGPSPTEASVATFSGRHRRVAVDRVSGLQPARVDRTRIGARDGGVAARSPGGSARRRPACAAPASGPA